MDLPMGGDHAPLGKRCDGTGAPDLRTQWFYWSHLVGCSQKSKAKSLVGRGRDALTARGTRRESV
ncbi:hypothetical protein, partial [Xanthomonas hortorum]|uniref:hypothetical protein n=1 Tax=Xanthomonas hortorum TaxID=56454 RepID=UPI002042FBF7